MRRPRVQLLAASLAVTLSVTFMGIGVTLSAPHPAPRTSSATRPRPWPPEPAMTHLIAPRTVASPYRYRCRSLSVTSSTQGMTGGLVKHP